MPIKYIINFIHFIQPLKLLYIIPQNFKNCKFCDKILIGDFMKIIKIGSTWCSGCVVMRPVWDKVEKQRTFNSEYFDYDIYEDMLKEKYNIGDKLPVIVFLDKNEKELERIIGEVDEKHLLELIDKYGDM